MAMQFNSNSQQIKNKTH